MSSSHLIVFTDLDGTLLDARTYGYDASLPAIRRLQGLEIPLVLCSSKTRSEMVPLWRELGLRDPFICENGGAVYFPPDYFPLPVTGATNRNGLSVIALGSDIAALRAALADCAAGLDVRIRSFGDMDAAEVSGLTGLSVEQASRALEREYDEPFTAEGPDRERLFRALRARGLAVTFGGRLFHLTGGHHKGHAVQRLRTLFHAVDPACASIGLGNSANDLELFREVDRPILIPDTDGSYDPEVLQALPWIERALEAGPRGWNSVIHRILAEHEPA